MYLLVNIIISIDGTSRERERERERERGGKKKNRGQRTEFPLQGECSGTMCTFLRGVKQ